MQVEMDTSDPNKYVLSVTVPKGIVEKESAAVATKIQPKVVVNGFRKGTAPLDVIQRTYADLIRGEVSAMLVHEKTAEALRQNKLENAGNPVLLEEFRTSSSKRWLGKFNMDGTFTFKVSVEPPPSITLGDYRNIKLAADDSESVTWLKKKMSEHQMAFASRETVSRPAAIGDQLVVDFEAFIGGVLVPGSKEEGYIITSLGSGELSEEFEKDFVNKSAGEEFSSSVQFPSNHPDPVFKGNTVQFKALIKEVIEVKPHPLNDELASLFSYESIDAMMNHYKEEWEKEFAPTIRAKFVSQIRDQLVEMHQFNAPQSWIDNEIDLTIRRLGMKPEDVRRNDGIVQTLQTLAEKNVKSSYVLDKIYEQEPSIHLTAEDIVRFSEEDGVKYRMSGEQLIISLRQQGQYEGWLVKCQHEKTLDLLIALSQQPQATEQLQNPSADSI